MGGSMARPAAMVLGLLLLVQACGGASDLVEERVGEQQASQTEQPEETPLPVHQKTVAEYDSSGVNELVNRSNAAFVGRVTEVGSPRWNSDDGRSWSGEYGENEDGEFIDVEPVVLRDVEIEVKRVIFDSPELEVQPDETITMQFFGDGDPDGVPPWYEEDLYGPIEAGRKTLIIAYEREMQTESGTERIVTSNYWQGYWRVRDDTAVNLKPARTVPLEPLISRLEEERRVGRDPSRDEGTTFNPLGSSEGSSPSPDSGE